MGTCQSVQREEAVSPQTPLKEKNIPKQEKTEIRTQVPEHHPLKEEIATAQHGYLSDDVTAELSESLRIDVPSRSPTKRGYSSGGSSISDENTRFDSGHSHLAEWKNELPSNGGLSSAVVHIETDLATAIEDVYEGVHDGPVLGKGVSGIVRRVTHRATRVNYAVKCLDLGLLRGERELRALRDEIFIMCQLDHPNIVRLEEVYENESELYLIQELCTGGDLFDRLDEQPDYHYSEAKCASLVKMMLSSVRYLHSKKIIHRDLKLENFLFSSTDPDSELKMIDFGLSKHFADLGELQHDCVGTPYTVAPEVIRAQYDEKIDIWSLGVIVFLLLSGETPFGGVDGECLLNVRENILEGKVYFDPAIWSHVSDAGKAFVLRLLNPDASKRPTAKEAQLDEWLQTFGKKDTEEGGALSPKIVQALVDFRQYSDMRKVLCEVLSFTLLPEQIAELRKEFEKIDHDGDGEISLGELKQVLQEQAESGSLGALTEHQIEDIFNALRFQKTEPTIQWHEFIAAGLSQCNFDERNLKLAFDRLDYDRKGFITLQNMQDLLASSRDKDGDILKLWKEGMSEFTCPLGRFTYDDFRMMLKGQGKEREIGSPHKKVHRRKSHDHNALQAVPEGSISPTPRSSVFANISEGSALESLRMPALNFQEDVKAEAEVNIPYPPDMFGPPTYKRIRSASLGSHPIGYQSQDEKPNFPKDESLQKEPTRRASYIILRNRVIGDDEDTSQAAYKAHNEFRKSVLEASKTFEQKYMARKLEIAAKATSNSFKRQDNARASLVMRRQSDKARQMEQPQLQSNSDHERKEKVEDASRRSGRPRRQRQKTNSDISGMLR